MTAGAAEGGHPGGAGGATGARADPPYRTGPWEVPPDAPLGWLPGRLPRTALDLAVRATAKRTLSRLRDPAVLRRALEADVRLFRQPEGARYADAALPGPTGPMVATWAVAGAPARRVAGGEAADGPAPPQPLMAGSEPVILYLHGGAFIAGSPRTHRHLAATLAAEAGGTALLPDYRLAPEHRLPAALDDAEAAWRALLDAGIAPARIAIAGDSAGGWLAAALLARLTAAGATLPGAVVLFSPWTDMTGSAPTLAAHARADAMLPAHRFDDLLDFCLPEGADPADPRFSPARAAYRDPPPAFIAVGSHEILSDDAEALARGLEAAGGSVTREIGQRLPHVWPIFRGWFRPADRTLARAGAFVARHCAAG